VNRSLFLCWTLAVLLAVTGCGGNDPVEPGPEEPTGDVEPAAPAETDEPEKVDPSAPLQMRTIELYFPSAKTNGLVREFREIFDTATPGDSIKQIIADLISGPTSNDALRVLPPGTQLRQAYVLDNGVAYLDFSPELAEGVGGGSMAEILVVYSIIDSVVVNIPEIKRVAILVNGRTLTTLNGHLDLRRALPADYQLIIGSIIVRRSEERATEYLAQASVENESSH